MATLRELDARGVRVTDIGLRRPTLDDVFLTLTGHAAEPAGGSQPGPDDPDDASGSVHDLTTEGA
jgi:ABC-2 type transport system ATP-binding protein